MDKSGDRYKVTKRFGRIFFKKYRKRSKIIKLSKNQTLLPQFFSKSSENDCKEFRLPSWQKVIIPKIPKHLIKSEEFVALQNYRRVKSYLKHIFQLNSMEYWDNLKLNKKLKRVFNKISIKKFFQMEICRYKRGVDRIWAWVDELNYNRALFSILDISKDEIPSLLNMYQRI